jgi:integrase
VNEGRREAHMNGSIRRRGKHSWELTIDLGRDAQGKRRRKFVHVKGTRAEADRRLRDILTGMDKGLPVTTSKETVAAYLERWLRDYVEIKVRPRTAESYRILVKRHIVPVLGDIPLARLQPGDAQGMLADVASKGLSKRTQQSVYQCLSHALKQAIRWGILYRNIMNVVDRPKAEAHEPIVPDSERVGTLLREVEASPYFAHYWFLAYTGVRRGEALGLRWRDVDLERGTASIVQTVQRVNGQGLRFQPPKSARSRRSITLDTRTIAVLKAHRVAQIEHRIRLGGAYHDMELVFPSPHGKPLDPSVLTHTWEKLRDKAGLKGVRLHDLRHLHATLLLQAGTNPKVVQERLGHSSIAVTMDIYSHVLPTLQREAAETFARAMQGSVAGA